MFGVSATVAEVIHDLGVRLAQKRIARGMTQEELALRAGVSKRTVERMEKGVSDSRLSALVSVCQVLGLTEGFGRLVPEVDLGPLALAEGKRLPKRVRKSTKVKIVKWGNEK